MSRFKTLTALTLMTAGIILACNSRNREASRPADKTANIRLDAVTKSSKTLVFYEVKRVKLLPRAVLDKMGNIAEPTERFNTTDVGESNVPRRQLIVAAISQQYAIVSYWQGGFTLGLQTSIFELSNGKATLIWVSEGQGGFNFRDLKEMVESGRMHNDLRAVP
jgi:hypothetical protein